jgi:hypothetical protein
MEGEKKCRRREKKWIESIKKKKTEIEKGAHTQKCKGRKGEKISW